MKTLRTFQANATRHRDESFSLKRPFSRVYEYGEGDKLYLDGEIITPFGVVSVYSQKGYSKFDVAHGMRHYMRSSYRSYSRRGLVTQAMRFIKEIIRK